MQTYGHIWSERNENQKKQKKILKANSQVAKQSLNAVAEANQEPMVDERDVTAKIRKHPKQECSWIPSKKVLI